MTKSYLGISPNRRFVCEMNVILLFILYGRVLEVNFLVFVTESFLMSKNYFVFNFPCIYYNFVSLDFTEFYVFMKMSYTKYHNVRKIYLYLP